MVCSNSRRWSDTPIYIYIYIYIHLHSVEVTPGAISPARIARVTDQNWARNKIMIKNARGMARCPFARQAIHPGYGSMPIHPPSVSTNTQAKLWAIWPRIWHPLRCEQTMQTEQPITLKHPPILRSRPPSQPKCRNPSFQRRRVSLASLGK